MRTERGQGVFWGRCTTENSKIPSDFPTWLEIAVHPNWGPGVSWGPIIERKWHVRENSHLSLPHTWAHFIKSANASHLGKPACFQSFLSRGVAGPKTCDVDLVVLLLVRHGISRRQTFTYYWCRRMYEFSRRFLHLCCPRAGTSQAALPKTLAPAKSEK